MRTTQRGVAALACALAMGAVGSAGAPPARAAARPNIVVIQTDDQNASDLTARTMPQTMRTIVRPGTRFSNYVVATPQCCPSRASLMTGDYPHNDGVTNNAQGYLSLRDPESMLPSWLQAAGYRTAHIGKFLNRYDDDAGSIAIPAPGWDDWFSLPDATRYYNFEVGDNGILRHYGTAPADYLTRVLDRHAAKVVRAWSAGRRPFYLQLDERAPHETTGRHGTSSCPKGPVPRPIDASRFSSARLPRPPSFNEDDMSDKPTLIRGLPKLSRSDIKTATDTYRCRLESLREVDRGVRAIRSALKSTHSLSHTVFVFLSDNGFFLGEHRIAHGKILPYEEALRQPMAIRLPAADRPSRRVPTVTRAAANIDIAPTLLQLAGAAPCTASGDCRRLDGRSLVPLLKGRRPRWSAHRSLLVEFSDPQIDYTGVCSYTGVHAVGRAYVHYTSAVPPGEGGCQPIDETETYDLKQDPFQLENLFPAPAGTPEAARQSRLRAKLRRLRDCAGIRGRDPRPPSGHFCD